MSRFSIARNDVQILVNSTPDEVFKFLEQESRKWPWKCEWSYDLVTAQRSFYVKGHFLKDNAAAAECEIIPAAEGGTVLQIFGSRGDAMNALGGNVFNVGVKKFQNKVFDEIEKNLRSA